MKLKQNLLTITTIFMLALSANSQAGRQGINAYYGFGFGALSITDHDVAGTGNLMFGLEEDGWAIEAVGLASVEAGTDLIGAPDYSIRGVDVGLAYRSIEKNNSYYIFKYSKTDVDATYKLASFSTTYETSGNSITLGMGFRVSRENRLEVSYSYHNNDDYNDPIHLINATYLWGGAPYTGRDL